MRFTFFSIFFLLLSCKKESVQHISSHENAHYDKAFEFLEKNVQDSAYINFNKAKNDFIQNKDSLKVAKCYAQMAIILCDGGDYFGSEEQSVKALKFLKANKIEDKDVLFSIYNNLGIVNLNQKNYQNSIAFFEKSQKLAQDSLSRLFVLNNEANVYQHQKNYVKSIEIYERILSKTSSSNQKEKDRVITNLAYTKFLQNPNYKAEPELNKALQHREQAKDFWGQNASHAHLSDYFAKKDREKSLFHAHKMYEVAKQLNSPDDKLEALQKLVLLENPENSKKYFQEYQKLSDSTQTAKNQAKNQFALIRYEVEKNKADLMKSKAENAEKQNEILRQKIVVAILATGVILGYFWYKRRKKLMQKQKEIEVKNTQLKLSKKVHDVVANGLYQTMVEIQNLPEINKEKLLDEIEVLYEKSRDISHEATEKNSYENFGEKLSQKLTSFSSDETKVVIIGNSNAFWENSSTKIKKEVLYMLQELMVNMKKHSAATIVSLKFEKEHNFLKIKYQDNGLGISNLEKTKGSGIQNTENRNATIGGEINFEKNPKGGLIVKISIPI